MTHTNTHVYKVGNTALMHSITFQNLLFLHLWVFSIKLLSRLTDINFKFAMMTASFLLRKIVTILDHSTLGTKIGNFQRHKIVEGKVIILMGSGDFFSLSIYLHPVSFFETAQPPVL